MKKTMIRKTLAFITLLTVLMLSATCFAEGEVPAYVAAEGNLLINLSFEEIQDPALFEGDVFPGWTYETDAVSWSVLFSDGPGYTGNIAGATWCGDVFNFSVLQTIELAEAGTYKASVWVALGEATFGDSELRIKDAEGNVVVFAALPAVENNTNSEYQIIELYDVALEAGVYTFELFVPCTAVGNNSFFRIDEAFLGLQ